MRRRLLLLILTAGLSSACGSLSRDFLISGTITMAANLQAKIPHNNSVLFIIAKNMGGVPIAVRRIVNPQFPVSFSLTADDLLIPGARPKTELLLQVQMNSHGSVGTPSHGDLEGVHPDPVSPREQGIHITIDRQA